MDLVRFAQARPIKEEVVASNCVSCTGSNPVRFHHALIRGLAMSPLSAPSALSMTQSCLIVPSQTRPSPRYIL
jgi:hypothetical protein